MSIFLLDMTARNNLFGIVLTEIINGTKLIEIYRYNL
jgi:hypothetical protein